jgi:hypothetical protein
MAIEEEVNPQAQKELTEAVEDTTKGVRVLANIVEEASKREEKGLIKAGLEREESVLKMMQKSLDSGDMSDASDKARGEFETKIMEQEKTLSTLRTKVAEDDLAVQLENRPVFAGMFESLSSGFSQLGSSIKSDFSMLSGPLTALQATPGMKTIITILKLIGMWVAKLGLKLITGKLGFGGLAKKDPKTGALDVKGTLGMFGKWAKGVVGAGEKIDRKTGLTKVKVAKTEKTKKPGGDGLGSLAKKGKLTGMAALAATEKKIARSQMTLQERVNEFHEGMNKGWDNIKTNTAKKFKSMKKGVTDSLKSMGKNLKNMASGMLKAVKGAPMKALKLFQTASAAITGTFIQMGKVMLKHVKRMVVPIAAFIVASLLFLGSMIMAIVALIAPAIPYILIGIAIALLVAGLIWLGMKVMENWDSIKERFAMAFEQLSIWAAKAALWLTNALAPLRDTISMFFAKIMDGIASILNGAIGFINSMQPDWLKEWRGGEDIIDWRMDENNVEKAGEAATFRAAEREASGAAIEERERALADRKARYDAGGVEPSGDTNQQNVVVNQGSTTSKHVAASTRPTDDFAAGSALAQF